MPRFPFLLAVLPLALVLALTACSPKVKIFPDGSEPLREFVLEGSSEHKVLVIPLTGVITDDPGRGLFAQRPSVVQEVVSQLRMAASDPSVKAVVLKINSPGGTVTASDILGNEIERFKAQSGAKVVAAMMDVAASGGYYAALSADRILAHPTTLTGSVGVVFVRPKAHGLMDKVGLGVEVYTSGANKDMGSPFRDSTPEERAIIQGIIGSAADRFLGRVQARRNPTPEALERIATARVFGADEALALGLVDQVGYLPDALDLARSLAGLPGEARVVVYRRTQFHNDNLYNTATAQEGAAPALVSLGLENWAGVPTAGFHYLWMP